MRARAAGLLLLPHLAAAVRAIIIDAISFGAPAGTLVRLSRGEGAFTTGITPHEIGDDPVGFPRPRLTGPPKTRTR